MRAPEDVHPLFKHTSTNHLIQVVDAPIRENFYHILHSQPDEAFIKDVEAGRKVGFVYSDNHWVLIAYDKKESFCRLFSNEIENASYIGQLNAIADSHPHKNIGIQDDEDRARLEVIVKFSAAQSNREPVTEADASVQTVKILVCNTQHPYFFKNHTQLEKESAYSEKFNKLIEIIKKVEKDEKQIQDIINVGGQDAVARVANPAIYTFTEVHPMMLKHIEDYFNPKEYHILKQVYEWDDRDHDPHLVTVLKKSVVSSAVPLESGKRVGRVQSLLCTLADAEKPFVLHLTHLEHNGNHIDTTETSIISLVSHDDYSQYPQILTGDLNIPLQDQSGLRCNIATSIVPNHFMKNSPLGFNGKPLSRWDRAIGTLTLPALKPDETSQPVKLTFYEAIQKIEVESHDVRDPETGLIYMPRMLSSREREKSDESRLLSRFGSKYREFLNLFLKQHQALMGKHIGLKKILTQQKNGVLVYKSCNKLNRREDLIFRFSKTIWDKLKLFLDLDQSKFHYYIMRNKSRSQFLAIKDDDRFRNQIGEKIFLVSEQEKWTLYTTKESRLLEEEVSKSEDIKVLNDLSKKYQKDETKILDAGEKEQLEKIALPLVGTIRRQIEVVEHSKSAFLICDSKSNHDYGSAVVKAMTFLVDKQFKSVLALEEAVKKHCSCHWIKEGKIFYIQFSFKHRGQLVTQYLKQQFPDKGEIVSGDQFKLPMTEVPKNMAKRLNFLIETAAFTEKLNNDCCGLVTLTFDPKFDVRTGSFHVKFSDELFAMVFFLIFDQLDLQGIKLLLEERDKISFKISYKNFFKTLGTHWSKPTLSKTLVDYIVDIVNDVPYGIRPSQTEEGTIVSEKALPHKLIQRFELTQGKRTNSSFFYRPFSYALALGTSYADIAVSLYIDPSKLLAGIFSEFKNYIGENDAYLQLKGIVEQTLKKDANLLAQVAALQKHCSDKITLSKETSKSWIWSAPKSNKHTDLLHSSFIDADFLANLEFNYPAEGRMKTLQHLINTQEKRELFELCGKERKRDSGKPYNNIRKNSALLLLEQYLILSHPEYTAHDVWEHIKAKPVEYCGTGKNYPRESDGGELTLEKILTSVKKIENALSSLVTSNDVTTHVSEALRK